MAIIGIVLSVLYLVIMAISVSVFGFETLQNEEAMQEAIQELLGQ